MNLAKFVSLSLCFVGGAGLLLAQQQYDSHAAPSATFGNDRQKPTKPSKFRTIEGMVKDHSDNPVAGAIVQLKDLRTSKVVDFATKDDGKFAFHDLKLDVSYELLAKRADLTAPVKKVTPYDTRHDVILTFKLEPPAKDPPAKQP